MKRYIALPGLFHGVAIHMILACARTLLHLASGLKGLFLGCLLRNGRPCNLPFSPGNSLRDLTFVGSLCLALCLLLAGGGSGLALEFDSGANVSSGKDDNSV